MVIRHPSSAIRHPQTSAQSTPSLSSLHTRLAPVWQSCLSQSAVCSCDTERLPIMSDRLTRIAIVNSDKVSLPSIFCAHFCLLKSLPVQAKEMSSRVQEVLPRRSYRKALY
ncbi:hypothetical protein AUEXF2481DRAFT_169645 [Aureobasidium subglaciale EXF-2481]|uniref:Uncharacterized protein n=1 Tax=Aureobasidium subglaciale (strain EXF-2481) TaxID=1043005 RepID=A0A074ZLL9_AURSE|nr:uncharacterized protein AUEXF2481DRAFT_169645 [Aureobasidium subglaciale EXF-2481]KEQ99311.1 hypothetical protein AUEXF2481DRAFT_169645 [Aureobasidium subglaciale EXF-2481]